MIHLFRETRQIYVNVDAPDAAFRNTPPGSSPAIAHL